MHGKGDPSGVLIIGEQSGGRIAHVVYELATVGRCIADDLHMTLSICIPCGSPPKDAELLFAYGADAVTCLCHEVLKEYTTDGYANAVTEFTQQINPAIVLFCSTYTGRDYSPVVALRLNTDIVVDCTQITVKDGQLLCTRPDINGDMINLVFNRVPQMASVRPGVFDSVALQNHRSGIVQVAWWEPNVQSLSTRAKLIQKIAGGKQADLTNAKIIVAGGMGLMTKENFMLLYPLAKRLEAQVGCTRPCVVAGWAGADRQIGQTGISIKPDLYIGFGISGAIQHITGLTSAKTIIAINQNPNAQIFQYSTYGLVGDAKEVLVAMLDVFDKK